MPTRDDFRFVLQPWEHRGAHFDPRPDYVAPREADGVKQLFLLKVRANRVFFRLAEDETRVWGTTREIEGEVLPFWNRQLEEQGFARLFVNPVRLHVNSYDQTEMAALIDAQSNAWLCEWCSDVWWRAQTPPVLEKYVRTHHKLGVWDSRWRPYGHKILSRNREAIANLPMPSSERGHTSMRWLCGSEEELMDLLRNFCLVHFDALNQLTVDNAYSPQHIPNRLSFELRSDSIESEAKLQFDPPWSSMSSHRFLEMLDVFLAYNRVAGVKWERVWNREQGAIRGDWRPSSFVQAFGFYRQSPLPAQREQARFRLRQWLHDKAPATNIEAWLPPSRDT